MPIPKLSKSNLTPLLTSPPSWPPESSIGQVGHSDDFACGLAAPLLPSVLYSTERLTIAENGRSPVLVVVGMALFCGADEPGCCDYKFLGEFRGPEWPDQPASVPIFKCSSFQPFTLKQVGFAIAEFTDSADRFHPHYRAW